MTLATKSGAVIVKNQSLATNCACCSGCVDCVDFLSATAVELDVTGYDYVINTSETLSSGVNYRGRGNRLSVITGTWSLSKISSTSDSATWRTTFNGAKNCVSNSLFWPIEATVILSCPGFPRGSASYATRMTMVWSEGVKNQLNSPLTVDDVCGSDTAQGTGLTNFLAQTCELVDATQLPNIFTRIAFFRQPVPYTERTLGVDRLRINSVKVYF